MNKARKGICQIPDVLVALPACGACGPRVPHYLML